MSKITETLKKVGYGDAEIKALQEKFDKEVRVIQGLTEDDYKLMALERLVQYTRTLVNDPSIPFKGLIIGVSELRDKNKQHWDYAVKHAGETRKHTSGKGNYIVEEGRYSWGKEQGKEIATDNEGNFIPLYEMSAIVAREDSNGNFQELATVNFTGNKCVEYGKEFAVGKIINCMINPSNNTGLYWASNKSVANVTGDFSHDELQEYIKKNLQSLVTDVATLSKEKSQDPKLCILMGNVSELNVFGKGNGSFSLSDPVNLESLENTEFGSLSFLKCTTENKINFIDLTRNLIVIGRAKYVPESTTTNGTQISESLEMAVTGTIVTNPVFLRKESTGEIDTPEDSGIEDEEETVVDLTKSQESVAPAVVSPAQITPTSVEIADDIEDL